MNAPDRQPVGPDKIHFSVVIPLYNKEATIERAIGSVLNQTVQASEIIVVNDGSTDNGPKVVESMDDPRIRLVHQDNQGVSAARNRGIAEATHDLIAFLDADDEWLPGFLETIHHLAADYPHCAAYATRYLFGMPDGRTRPCIIRGLPDGFSGILEDYFKIAAKSDPPIHSSAVVIKKAAINAVGGFPVGVKSGEDLLTWARVAIKFPIACSTKIRAVFWVPDGVVSRPERFVNHKDIVGKQLRQLSPNVPHFMIASYRKYLQRWYEMQAIISLQLHRRIDFIKYLNKAFRSSTPNAKLIFMTFLIFFPFKSGINVFTWFRKIRNYK